TRPTRCRPRRANAARQKPLLQGERIFRLINCEENSTLLARNTTRKGQERMTGAVEQDNMLIEWDAAIVMDDGVVMRADIFRPKGEGRWPVLLTYGPYAKGLAFQKG